MNNKVTLKLANPKIKKEALELAYSKINNL